MLCALKILIELIELDLNLFCVVLNMNMYKFMS